MTAIKDGGPAYPRNQYVNPNGVVVHDGSGGMSLRDWFAGQASDNDIHEHRGWVPDADDPDSFMMVATYTREQARYRFADAMLAARDPKETPNE